MRDRLADLNRALVEAIEKGEVERFIQDLKQRLQSRPFDHSLWLVAARAYDASDDVQRAANCYVHVIRLCDPRHPNTPILLKEVQTFATRRRQEQVARLAEERLGQARHGPSGQAGRGPAGQGTGAGGWLAPGWEGMAESVQILVKEGNDAFQRGDLEDALAKFERAYELGDRSPKVFLLRAHTLQRMQRYSEALSCIDAGLKAVGPKERQKLLHLKAQILSSQMRWREAAELYEQLIGMERARPNTWRSLCLQVARLYQNLGQIDLAKAKLDEVLLKFPDDQVAARLRAALDYYVADAASVTEFEVDLPDEGIDLISPMLRSDLAKADFRDEKILLQGGQPTVDDANRLLDMAEKSKGSEFGERYPLFLEAAKAFSMLPAGSYELQRFHRALARYAALKGGALISEFRRLYSAAEPDLEELRRVRDSATSYWLESLALQVEVEPRVAIVFLRNHLRVQVAYALAERRSPPNQDVFEWNVPQLLRFCFAGDDSLLRIALESVVAWGAASTTRAWNELWKRDPGLRVIYTALQDKGKRERCYQILGDISRTLFRAEQRPGEVLTAAFLTRRQQNREIQRFLTSIQKTPLTVENFAVLRERWMGFPSYPGTLLDTDVAIQKGIENILSTLQPYQARSPEERTGILVTARTQVERLLRLIQDRPTYWGRTGFEPLLSRWLDAIREIEQRRIRELQPKLTSWLDPPVFYPDGPEGEFIRGSMILLNNGRGTAEGARLAVRVLDYDTQATLYQYEHVISQEIAVQGTCHHEVRIPTHVFPHGTRCPYRLQVAITPIFRQTALETCDQEFTLEVYSGNPISIHDIPWNEMQIPPEHLFKGREELINRLVSHVQSADRHRTYILYGLTRTGKSSILTYLAKKLDLQPVNLEGNRLQLISFSWDMAKAAAQTNARDMWGYLLEEELVGKLERLAEAGKIEGRRVPQLRDRNEVRFRDWDLLLKQLRDNGFYPVFLVDEFSYYKELISKKRLDASFLAAVRTFAIEGRASFIVAGTYDLRQLIKDPAYGITGQFVNAIEQHVSRIDEEPAIELIQAMEPQLHFTRDAVDHILRLSYRIPYFIQLLCRNCAYYAAESGRNVLGFPEVDAVVQILVGETDNRHAQGITRIPPGVFMNNMDTPTDPPVFKALISTICHLTRGQVQPRPVTYSEIQEMWHKHGVRQFQASLAQAIEELTAREVLVAGEDEGMPTYRISVDLFRRWWAQEHKFINVELDAIKSGGG